MMPSRKSTVPAPRRPTAAAPAPRSSSVSSQPRAGVEQVADDQADRQRDGRHHQEVAEREAADLADLGGLAHRADAQHDGAEDDRADQHLDQATKPVPSGLSATPASGATRPTSDAGADGDDHREVEPVGPVPPRAGCGVAVGAAVVTRSSWALPAGASGGALRVTVSCDHSVASSLRSLCSQRPRPAGGMTHVPGSRRASASPGSWSIARQLLVLQVLLLVALVGGGDRAAVLEAQGEHRRRRPGAGRGHRADGGRLAVRARCRGERPTPRRAAAVRRGGPARHRHGLRRGHGPGPHPLDPPRTPASIGKPFIGTIGRRWPGSTFTETYTGTLGPSVRAVVAGARRRTARSWACRVGITTERIGPSWPAGCRCCWPRVLALLVALAGAVLVSRRLRRQTHGLGPDESAGCTSTTTRCCTPCGRASWWSTMTGRCSSSTTRPAGCSVCPRRLRAQPVADLELPPALGRAAGQRPDRDDELHLTGDRALWSTRAPPPGRAAISAR